MGLKKKVVTNVDPWLCYYCGDCTTTCPRDANPGEFMMSMRRYLTSVYDWTGLSKLFYTSKIWEFVFVILFALAVILSFILFGPAVDKTLTAQGGVKLNEFAPISIIEIGDWTMAVIVAFLLISNIFNMFYKIVLSDKKVKVPFISYFIEIRQLIIHYSTQSRLLKCKKNRSFWVGHWLLMTGYTIMFIVVVVYLPWFQTEEVHSFYHPQRLLGYYATFGILFGLSVAIIGRLRKKEEKFKFSHMSDWLFIIMLYLVTLSGILIHIFRINGMPMATYYSYVAHMAILVPMIMIEVPFSKWSHLAYRPFAIYFSRLRRAGIRKQNIKINQLATA